MKKCAFLTLENREGFFLYDHLTFEPLGKLGWNVIEIPWDQANVDWSVFDAVVIRSAWDYQKAPERFLDVLATIESSGTRLFNPLSVCRWNLDKTYLRDLKERGISIVPTNWVQGLDEPTLDGLFKELNCQKIVVKPTVGANADDTFALTRSSSENYREAIATFPNRPLMAQPFVQSIVVEGEYSLFYFSGQFSHAVLKKPKQGDFRVQEEHGGSTEATKIEDPFLKLGQQVIDSIFEKLLYARIDLVRLADGQPALIELELIEPSLYFPFDELSPTRFANALDQLACPQGNSANRESANEQDIA